MWKGQNYKQKARTKNSKDTFYLMTQMNYSIRMLPVGDSVSTFSRLNADGNSGIFKGLY